MLQKVQFADIQNKKLLQMPVYFSSAKQLPWSITIWCSALLISLDSFTNLLIYSNATSDLLTDLFFKGIFQRVWHFRSEEKSFLLQFGSQQSGTKKNQNFDLNENLEV